MESSIFGYAYDFNNDNGLHLTFTHHEGVPLKEDDINALQMKMIESNTIPRLLPIFSDEWNLQLRLHYDLSSKRLLTAYLREAKLTWDDFAHLIIHTLEAMEVSSLYMLNRDQFIIHPDFLFVGNGVGDVYVTYLPITTFEREGTVEEDVRSLLESIVREHPSLQGAEWDEVEAYLQDPTFHLTGLKELLISTSSKYIHKQKQEELAQQMMAQQLAEQQEEERAEDLNEVHSKKKKKKEKQPLSTVKRMTQREKVYLGTGSLLALALVWKLYDMFTTSLWLDISLALTLVILLFDTLYILRRRRGTKKEKLPNERNREQQQEDSMQAPLASTENMAMQQVSSSEYVERESTLTDQNETTRGHVLETPEQAVPFLTVQRNGQTHSINVQEEPFVIGSQSDMVHHVAEEEGVSKIHAELRKAGEDYGIKDLGSQKGTCVNEQPIIPYKMYRLQHHDKISIGKHSFIFHQPQ